MCNFKFELKTTNKNESLFHILQFNFNWNLIHFLNRVRVEHGQITIYANLLEFISFFSSLLFKYKKMKLIVFKFYCICLKMECIIMNFYNYIVSSIQRRIVRIEIKFQNEINKIKIELIKSAFIVIKPFHCPRERKKLFVTLFVKREIPFREIKHLDTKKKNPFAIFSFI